MTCFNPRRLFMYPTRTRCHIAVWLLGWLCWSDGADIKLGMMSPFRHPRLGWENNAAAASLAIEKAQGEGILSQHNISIVWRDDKCGALGGTGSTVLLRQDEDVDVYIGPPCSSSTTPAGLLAAFWNLPMFSQASSDPSLADKSLYKTLVRLGPPFNKMGRALAELFKFYSWDNVAMISKRKTDNRNVFCDYSYRSMEEAFAENNIVIGDRVLINPGLSDAEIEGILRRIRGRGRIIVLCTEIPSDRRRILLKALEMGMADGNYVYVLPDHLPPANVATPWVNNDEEDARAKDAYKSAFQITVAEMAGPEVESFRDRVTTRMAEQPWNYNTTLRGSEYSAFLHDVVYLYLLVLNETLGDGGDIRNGTDMFERAKGKTFRGVTGTVKVDSNGDREPDYWIWDLAPSGGQFEVALEAAMTSNHSQKIRTLRPVTWETEDGKPPMSVPVCGFSNQLCPPAVVSPRNLIVGSVVSVLLVAVVVLVGGYFYRRSRFEKELQQQLWLAKWEDIKLTKTRITGSISQISLRTSSLGLSTGSSGMGEGQLFSQIGIYKGSITAVKKLEKCQITLNREDLLELKAMKDMQFENVNVFVGLCLDERYPCILTSYCSKGSLQDIVENDDIKLDWMFKVSLITDLVNGINFLHSSPLHFHGCLKSSNCVVDNRWVLKVTDFGLWKLRQSFRKYHLTDHQRNSALFWTAPEHLEIQGRSQKGDIYAIGVVLFEVLYRRPPYDTTLTLPSEIIASIAQGETPPFRPTSMLLESEKSLSDVMSRSVDVLAEKCWREDPDSRPSIAAVKRDVDKLQSGKKLNIVDNMVLKLERYANNLEEIVEHRTGQLIEEKKKTDTLLYRMLPPTVAERLKSGVNVEPEVFDSVTIYFSDIVGFTALSALSTPIQIVDFLNDLYTSFDSIIAKYDVYKVETIGDAYMVVSGLPVRNAGVHCTEIADMSLDLLNSISRFRIPHLQNRALQLRIGVHTGSCAAGVVGRTMPRYCLFGDTVNMASRMESTGEAMMIHLSQEARDALHRTQRYIIDKRGELDIKGKGLQTTYWLTQKI